MTTDELIRQYADNPRLHELGIDFSTPLAVEKMRERYGGRYGAQTFRRTSDWDDIALTLGLQAAQRDGREPTSDLEWTDNLVTNEGLASLASVYLDAATQITVWYLTLSSSNTAPAGTMTAAVPVFTEIDATDVTETVRETWTGGTVTGTTTASIDNAAAVATYTCDVTGFTAWGAAMIGGGTSAFGNTAGTLYSFSLFASQKVMASTDTIDVTYTQTYTDS